MRSGDSSLVRNSQTQIWGPHEMRLIHSDQQLHWQRARDPQECVAYFHSRGNRPKITQQVWTQTQSLQRQSSGYLTVHQHTENWRLFVTSPLHRVSVRLCPEQKREGWSCWWLIVCLFTFLRFSVWQVEDVELFMKTSSLWKQTTGFMWNQTVELYHCWIFKHHSVKCFTVKPSALTAENLQQVSNHVYSSHLFHY